MTEKVLPVDYHIMWTKKLHPDILAKGRDIIKIGSGCSAQVETNGEVGRCGDESRLVLFFELLSDDEFMPVCSEDHLRHVARGVARDLLCTNRKPIFGLITPEEESPVESVEDDLFRALSEKWLKGE